MKTASVALSLALGCLAGALPSAAFAADLPARDGDQRARCLAPAAAAAGGKSGALLGGRTSRLEQLRREQAAPSAGATAARPAAVAGRATILPAAAADCSRFALPQQGTLRPGRLPLGADDFLASKRLPVSHTSFDGQWDRVRSAGLSRAAAAPFAALSPSRDGERLLAAVNAYANRRIRYVEDRELYGRADYWATAGATLQRGAGDCEDIAVAKLQLLAAAGVPHGDMYLTIARDLVRNADHAVLVVRLEGRYWLLDNSADRVVDAGASLDYRPIFSFSGDRRWLHGY